MTYPHLATIQKSTKTGTQYAYANIATTECFLQPVNAERAQLYGLVFTKAFNLHMPIDVDISERNRVVINGQTYGVKGVSSYPYGTTIDHKTAVLELTA